MFKKLRAHLSKGIFRYYFVAPCIQNASDRDAFTTFYEYRVAAVVVTYLLGLNPIVTNNKMTVNTPDKSAELTFFIAPGNPRNDEAFSTDIDSLINYENFLIDYANEYFKDDDPGFKTFEEVQEYVLNTLLARKRFDNYATQTYQSMISDSKSDIFHDRVKSNGYDQDKVFAAAYTSLMRLDELSNQKATSITRALWSKILQDSLEYQFQLQNDEVLSERRIAATSEESQKRQIKFWDYLLRAKRIQEHPEMW